MRKFAKQVKRKLIIYSFEIALFVVGSLMLLTITAMASDAAKYSDKDRNALTNLIKNLDNKSKRNKQPDVIQQAWMAVVNREIITRGCDK